MREFFKGKSTRNVASLLIGACIAVFFAACGTTVQAGSATTTIPTTIPTISVPTVSVPNILSTQLTHSPVGTVDLNWDAQGHALTVQVAATGLAPDSTHPEHIHAGSCATDPMGPIVYTLTPLVANAHGVATARTTIANVANGIPAHGWYVNIHNGPTLNAPGGANPIACANITESGTSSSPVHAELAGTMAPDESAHGTAQLSITGNKLVVTLSLSGLVPHSVHMAHIHAGSCADQGAVVYPLQPVTADAQGNATTNSTITISNILQFTTSQLYVNVHEAGTMAAMKTQQGFDPIACGDIMFHS